MTSRGGKSSNKDKNSFIWSDDEVELLLNIVLDFKTTKAQESVDWDSVYTKYTDIHDAFLEQYPDRKEAEKVGKDFPHEKESITKVTIISKLKNVKGNYRKAVDSGRRSGHGRVVMIFFELCEQIWGGSPATEALSSGVESTDIMGDNVTETSVDSSVSEEPEVRDDNARGTASAESDAAEIDPSTSVVKERRHFLQKTAENKVHEDLQTQSMRIYVCRQPHAVGIVIDGIPVLMGLDNMPEACCLLLGLTYALNLDYPAKLAKTFEVFQRLFVELDTLQPKPTSNYINLKNRLFT